VHSDWQSTEAFLYVIGKSNSITWKYIIVIDIKEKHNFKLFLLYIQYNTKVYCIKYTYTALQAN